MPLDNNYAVSKMRYPPLERNVADVIIRPFRKSTDEQSALELCKYAHATTKYANEEFDDSRVLLHGTEVDEGVRDVCGFVAVEGNKVVGLIFGYRIYNFININSIAIDRALYVLPEYRSVGTFDKLLTAFEQWAAEDAWCKQAIISVTEMDRCASVHRLLRTRGYTLKYRQFGKEL